MSFKAYADNVLLLMEPEAKMTEGGLHVVIDTKKGRRARESRTARVLYSGRGYYTPLGALVENQTRAGDRVIVDSLAGQNYDFDLTAPRHHALPQEFKDLMGERGEYRIVREGEILAVMG